MRPLATNRDSTVIRPIDAADVRPLLRLIDTAWRVHLRVSPTELSRRLKSLPGFVAEDDVGLRGFAIFEPLATGLAMLLAAGLRDTWSIRPYLDLFLPRLVEAATAQQMRALVHIGSAGWLTDELERRGFEIKEWIVAFERQGTTLPPEPIMISAELRSAHVADLSALLALDDLTFEHIWHKSAGTYSQALARAASFTVALVDEQIIAYQWCELYSQHAHLTRLAVHPDYQGRGIGAQLLHRAISDVLMMGADLITLNTQENNRRSQALYERFGFVNTHQRMPILWLELPN